MKQIYKTIISVFIILMLASMTVVATNTEKTTTEINTVIPIPTDPYEQQTESISMYGKLYIKVCCIDESYVSLDYTNMYFMLPIQVEIWDRYLNPINASVTVKIIQDAGTPWQKTRYNIKKWTGSNKFARFGYRLPWLPTDEPFGTHSIMITARDKSGNTGSYKKTIELHNGETLPE